jgi:hypothetical protein
MTSTTHRLDQAERLVGAQLDEVGIVIVASHLCKVSGSIHIFVIDWAQRTEAELSSPL